MIMTMTTIMMKKNMKIKFNSDDELPLNETIEIPTMTLVV